MNTIENPIQKLGELVQRKFRASMTTEVIDKDGEDHCPTIFVKITLPNGKEFKAHGLNQREAKKVAALEALAYLK
jgi:dsRNA-specific ribonuclease